MTAPAPTAMQTSALGHQPDLMEYTGILVATAQARTRVLDGQTSVPVVCFDIELDSARRNIMHVEQAFPVGYFPQAQAAAHRLKKGTRVTVQTQLLDLQLVARNAAHIRVIKDQKEEQPCHP